MKKKKPNNKKMNYHQGTKAPLAMPMDFKNRILQLEGPKAIVSEEKLLVQKILTMSDVPKNQNRILIPTK